MTSGSRMKYSKNAFLVIAFVLCAAFILCSMKFACTAIVLTVSAAILILCLQPIDAVNELSNDFRLKALTNRTFRKACVILCAASAFGLLWDIAESCEWDEYPNAFARQESIRATPFEIFPKDFREYTLAYAGLNYALDTIENYNADSSSIQMLITDEKSGYTALNEVSEGINAALRYYEENYAACAQADAGQETNFALEQLYNLTMQDLSRTMSVIQEYYGPEIPKQRTYGLIFDYVMFMLFLSLSIVSARVSSALSGLLEEAGRCFSEEGFNDEGTESEGSCGTDEDA